uniref:Elongation of very long chain fatty acids protein n=1 Tax=Meloidogyne hapla TaxID=6305 RepID=A0A1I8BAI1_MELHA
MLKTIESQTSSLPSLWQNITTHRDFNAPKFIEILTSSDFPEDEARRWVDDRYPLTIQYYFLRSMKIKVPGPVAKFVTTIQIWQFIISVVILIHLGWLTFVENVKCDLDSKVFAFAVSMDVSYLILFINFFLHAYILRGGKAKYRNEKVNNGSANTKKDEQQNS